MGAKPSGFELLPFEVETLGKMDGELAGEQSGVDFLSENKRKILFYFLLKTGLKIGWPEQIWQTLYREFENPGFFMVMI